MKLFEKNAKRDWVWWLQLIFSVVVPGVLAVIIVVMLFKLFFGQSESDKAHESLENAIQSMQVDESQWTVPAARLEAVATELASAMQGMWMLWNDYEYADMVKTCEGFNKQELLGIYRYFGVRTYPYFGVPVGTSGDMFRWFEQTMDEEDYQSARTWWKDSAGI